MAIDGKPGVFGVYAWNVGTRETVDIHADRVLPAETAARTFVPVYYSLVAAGAVEQTDFASRPDDIAPTLFGVIAELLYDAWGTQPLSSSG